MFRTSGIAISAPMLGFGRALTSRPDTVTTCSAVTLARSSAASSSRPIRLTAALIQLNRVDLDVSSGGNGALHRGNGTRQARVGGNDVSIIDNRLSIASHFIGKLNSVHSRQTRGPDSNSRGIASQPPIQPDPLGFLNNVISQDPTVSHLSELPRPPPLLQMVEPRALYDSVLSRWAIPSSRLALDRSVLHDPRSCVSVASLHGGAGVGKTRAASEFARFLMSAIDRALTQKPDDEDLLLFKANMQVAPPPRTVLISTGNGGRVSRQELDLFGGDVSALLGFRFALAYCHPTVSVGKVVEALASQSAPLVLQTTFSLRKVLPALARAELRSQQQSPSRQQRALPVLILAVDEIQQAELLVPSDSPRGGEEPLTKALTRSLILNCAEVMLDNVAVALPMVVGTYSSELLSTFKPTQWQITPFPVSPLQPAQVLQFVRQNFLKSDALLNHKGFTLLLATVGGVPRGLEMLYSRLHKRIDALLADQFNTQDEFSEIARMLALRWQFKRYFFGVDGGPSSSLVILLAAAGLPVTLEDSLSRTTNIRHLYEEGVLFLQPLPRALLSAWKLRSETRQYYTVYMPLAFLRAALPAEDDMPESLFGFLKRNTDIDTWDQFQSIDLERFSAEHFAFRSEVAALWARQTEKNKIPLFHRLPGIRYPVDAEPLELLPEAAPMHTQILKNEWLDNPFKKQHPCGFVMLDLRMARYTIRTAGYKSMYDFVSVLELFHGGRVLVVADVKVSTDETRALSKGAVSEVLKKFTRLPQYMIEVRDELDHMKLPGTSQPGTLSRSPTLPAAPFQHYVLLIITNQHVTHSTREEISKSLNADKTLSVVVIDHEGLDAAFSNAFLPLLRARWPQPPKSL